MTVKYINQQNRVFHKAQTVKTDEHKNYDLINFQSELLLFTVFS